ncbi:ABC transporter substrate-binding protein, partial [candidate division WOR-3 bacterium]|nr:ABC transporter substrate-binding protein [candidate division WOR-3 bacterium]
YVSILGEAETIHKPIERIVDMVGYPSEVLRILNAEDRVVAISSSVGGKSYQSWSVFFPEHTKLPTVGSWYTPDYEAVLSHNPDAVVSYMPQAAYWAEKKAEWNEKLPGVHIIALSFVNPLTGNKWTEIGEYNDLIQSTRKLGYILDKEDEAEEFCDWYEGYFNLIKSRTDELSEDEKPKVYYENRRYRTWHTTRILRIIDVAGGINFVRESEKYGTELFSGEVDSEWVMEQNPDIILSNQNVKGIYPGYHWDDSSGIIEVRDSILNRPELANVNATKNNRVYVLTAFFTNGPHTIIAIAYCAKWFHPDLFKDLDPKAIHQEYLDNFHEDLNFNVYEHGVFVYPEPS